MGKITEFINGGLQSTDGFLKGIIDGLMDIIPTNFFSFKGFMFLLIIFGTMFMVRLYRARNQFSERRSF